MSFEREAVSAALKEHGSIAAAARALGASRRRLSEYVNADAELSALRWSASKAAQSITVTDDALQVTSDTGAQTDHDGVLQELGYNPAEWYCVELKRWQTYHGEDRWTTVYKRRLSLRIVSPAVHVPAMPPRKVTRRDSERFETVVIEGDQQAPYHEIDLNLVATEFIRDVQPQKHVFLGDTLDLPTISRHADHRATMFTGVQECVNAGYAILRARAEAAPDAERLKLKGNHDYRIESELLSRDERMSYITPAEETEPALSLRRLLHLGDLGIELVEDVRGWEHAEIELVPGGNGLVVRHGLVTGERTARRTLAKLGRSAIVGHGHQKEAAYRLTYPKKRLQQGFVAGTMCRVDGPGQHFAVNPDWHQGFVTATIWPDGQFLCEHAVYQNGSLFWRDKRWNVRDYK